MEPKVYFLPIEKIKKLEQFIYSLEFFENFKENEKVALKIHFGNSNHQNQIPFNFISPIVNKLKGKKVFQFLTDTNVLYKGERADTFSHLNVAYKKNFNKLGIPILIAGGYDGNDEFEIEINGKHFKKGYFAREYKEIDGMIALSHFKGHMLSGIGGTIKNIAMGCASRRGKFALHSSIVPQINISICVGCGKCEKQCPVKAISIINKKANIDERKCIGCASCVHICVYNAINIPWSSITPDQFQERLVEYAYGIINFYKGKFFAINFIINVAGDCDCLSNPGEYLCKDIGIVASNDPISIDKASSDLIREFIGKDVFKNFRPNLDYIYQLYYGEKISLGSTKYKLIEF